MGLKVTAERLVVILPIGVPLSRISTKVMKCQGLTVIGLMVSL